MSWNAITADEVLEEFNPKEQAKLNELQGASDNLDSILGRVVNAVRGSILAGGGQVDQPGTIPDQLREDVIAVARWRWLISIPAQDGQPLQSKEREKVHDDAMKRFDDVAAGKVRVELPSTPVVTQAPTNAVQVATKQDRFATRQKMDGLA